MVEAAWRSCVSLNPNKEILGKIEKCGKDLSWWNYNVFGNVRRELKKKRDMLAEEEALAMRTSSNVLIKELQREINVAGPKNKDVESTLPYSLAEKWRWKYKIFPLCDYGNK